MANHNQEPKVQYYEAKDIGALAPECGKKQDARGGDESSWDRSAIIANMLTTGGYSPTEGPLVAFQDELDGLIPEAAKTWADGNLRALAIADILEMVAAGTAPKECAKWKIPVLIYPAGLSQEERENIRNRARDTTQPKTRHDYYCWALKLALKNPTMGDTDLCRLIGPRPIRAQWPDAIRENSTYVDDKHVERFHDGLPLDGKDIPAMLVNKQGPIQEVTRVRKLPAFAREFFLLPPDKPLHKTFQSSRDWSNAWDQDCRGPFGPVCQKAQSLKELLTSYPDSKLGAKVAMHMATGKPERKNARGEGKGAQTAAERERTATTFSQAGTDVAQIFSHLVRFIGGDVGYTDADTLEFFEAMLKEDNCKLTKTGQQLLVDFEAGIGKKRQDVINKATQEEQAAEKAKNELQAKAIKKAKKG